MTKKLEDPKTKLYLIALVVIWYLFNKGAWLYHQMSPQVDELERLFAVINNYSRAFRNPFPSLAFDDVKIGLIGIAIAVGAYIIKNSDPKKYRKGIEYGSARWGTHKDIEPFIDHEDEDNNILLTQTERMKMNGRVSNPEYQRNKNILVVGGSGSGKTRFFVKPQLMQMHSSYVVTDPKGTILLECGKMLQRGPLKMEPVPSGEYKRAKDGSYKLDKDGKKIPIYKKDKNGKLVLRPMKRDGKYVHEPYDIKVFNTINFTKSMHYNPFQYIRKEEDIETLVTALVENTKGEGDKSGEDFWVSATC